MSTIKSKEDAGYTVNGTDLIPLVDAAGLVAKSVTPRQMFKNMRGDNVLLIGDGGDFSSYDDVLTELNTNLLQTVELSFTGTVTGTGTGTTLSYILTADAGTPLAGIAVGTVIAFRVDNATNKFPYVLGRVIDSAVIMANHPFPIDYASKNVDVCFPKYSKVQFLPGSEIILDSVQDMPPFVVLDGSENSAKIVVETSSNAVMTMGGETNEVYCNNLNVIQSEQQFVNFTLAPFSELGALMGDSYFYNCNIDTGLAVDGFQQNAGSAGNGIHVHGGVYKGEFDPFRFNGVREINLLGVQVQARISKDQAGTARCLTYTNTIISPYPLRKINIKGCLLEAYNHSENVLQAGVSVIDLTLPDNMTVVISGNTIRGHREPAATSGNECYGVTVADSTGEVLAIGNTFEVTGNGAATVQVMHSVAPGVFKQKNNYAVNGGVTSVHANVATAVEL